MSDLLGKNLQFAQDTLQSLGSYLLQQDDASGLERFQVLDSNWKVCSQNLKPGGSFSIDELAILGAVKLDELGRRLDLIADSGTTIARP